MDLTHLSDNFSVSPQITEHDLRVLAQGGFTDVICYRPEHEHPSETISTRVAKACAALGLSFHYHPFAPGEAFETQAKDLAQLMSKPNIKVCAYCRSGARAANVFAQVSAPT